jgi:uncharacterized membrane protein YphA (DoxX/SURF4 family)
MREIPILEVARLWLACVWIIAGVLKAREPGVVRAYIKRRVHASDRFAQMIVVAISVSEIVIGASLLAGFVVTEAAGLSVALLAAFTLILVTTPEREHGCGCFGVLDAAEYSLWGVITRNGTMSAVGVFIILADGPVEGLGMVRDPLAWLFAVTLVGISGAAYFVSLRLLPAATRRNPRVWSVR